jgi:hypothetical protein
MWGWARVGRNFQVLMVTLPHPDNQRGYTAYMAAMDVKSTEDYELALAPFAKMLKNELEYHRVGTSALAFHCDEEDALIAALESQFPGCAIVGCRFHKLQNLIAQIKGNMPKRM